MQDKIACTSIHRLIAFPKNLHIFIAGAGGIGCQLLKILYKQKNELTVVDYDTISQSNLNRQFCYRIQDIGKRKVEVLFQYFKSLNPLLKYHAQFGNLYDFDSLYFSQFDLLISALDNHEARCYLNSMAIKNGIPMIDAGTSGFNGQSQSFIRYVSECKMCRPQPKQSVNYAVCSLRGIPQRNIHCIYFALEMYKEIRNVHQQLHKCLDDTQSKENRKENEWSTLSKYLNGNIKSYSSLQLKEKCKDVFNNIFNYPIKQLCIQGISPINYHQISLQQLANILQIKCSLITSQCNNIIEILKKTSNDSLLDQKQLPQQLFSYIFTQLLYHFLISQNLQEFDKDIFEHVLFIFTATNLRIYNFMGNPRSTLNPMSYFQCKDLSGKIVPAIASTNSIASALEVLTLFNIVNNKHVFQQPKYISIKGYSNQYKIQSFLSQKPKYNCSHCSHLYIYAELQLMIDVITWGQLQLFLIQNFDNTLAQRDMRCGQYVIIRNSGQRPFISNKKKLINFNSKLITTSKLDNKTKIVTIKYMPMQKISSNFTNSQNSTQNFNWQSECYTIWQFILIHSLVEDREKYIKIRKQFVKEEHEKEVKQILKMMKSEQQQKKQSLLSNNIELFDLSQSQIIE